MSSTTNTTRAPVDAYLTATFKTKAEVEDLLGLSIDWSGPVFPSAARPPRYQYLALEWDLLTAKVDSVASFVEPERLEGIRWLQEAIDVAKARTEKVEESKLHCTDGLWHVACELHRHPRECTTVLVSWQGVDPPRPIVLVGLYRDLVLSRAAVAELLRRGSRSGTNEKAISVFERMVRRSRRQGQSPGPPAGPLVGKSFDFIVFDDVED